MLRVKLLEPGAKAPTVSNPGEDLGYDLYALEGVILKSGVPTKVRTGIAAEFDLRPPEHMQTVCRLPYGLLIRDRSSMASKGVIVSGGVIDAGYRAEIIVLMTYTPFAVRGDSFFGPYVAGYYTISAGDKIAQMIPMLVLTDNGVGVVEELSNLERGFAGFGSTGV